MAPKSNIKELKAEALLAYVALVQKLGRVPTNADLNRAGPSVSMVKHRWASFEKMDKAARKAHPSAFNDIRVEDAAGRLPKAKRYVIATAVTGAPVNGPFLEALRRYCTKHDAELALMVCEDPAAHVTRQGHLSIDKLLAPFSVVGRDTSLNRNLKLITLKTTAKMIDPTTGVRRLGAKGQSVILASPKQRHRPVATSGPYPQVVLTPGAVTLPAYKSAYYFSQRTAYLANEDHVCGALVVEIEDTKRFHFRHVQADKDGSFIDMGQRHSPSGPVKKVRPSAIIWGDIHAGKETPAHKLARNRLHRELSPRQQIVHDLFNGASISHHEDRKLLSRARKHEKLVLEDELETTRAELASMAAMSPVVVVRSNHDEWLTRYLESGRFMYEPQNVKIALKLASAMVDGFDPLEYAVGQAPVTWLKRDESYKVEGHECGHHGDKGPNGGPGSLSAFEASLGACVVGHSHSAEVLRLAKKVGTSTRLRMGYNQGPSSWSNSHLALYPGGLWQMINVIDGYYQAKKGS